MSLYTMRSGGTAHPEDSFLQMLTDFVRAGGVLDLSADANLKVVQRGAGANMSVDISIGRAFIKKTSGNVYPVRNTAAVNKTIGSNSSGSTRIDAVVIFIDTAAVANSDSSNVVSTQVVQGTTSAPSDSDIATAIGASNPFLRLANVTVANSASSITNANITDTRVQWRAKGSLKSGTTAYSATPTLDVGNDNYQHITLTGNISSMTLTGYQTDVPFFLKLTQDGTGGRTVTFFSNIDWFTTGGTAPVLSGASKSDTFMFIPKSDGRFEGYIVGQGGV